MRTVLLNPAIKLGKKSTRRGPNTNKTKVRSYERRSREALYCTELKGVRIRRFTTILYLARGEGQSYWIAAVGCPLMLQWDYGGRRVLYDVTDIFQVLKASWRSMTCLQVSRLLYLLLRGWKKRGERPNAKIVPASHFTIPQKGPTAHIYLDAVIECSTFNLDRLLLDLVALSMPQQTHIRRGKLWTRRLVESSSAR